MTGQPASTFANVPGALDDIWDELRRLRAQRQQVERDMAALNEQIELLSKQAHRTATRALRKAAIRGDADAVWHLLSEHSDVDVNARNRDGETALLLAVHHDSNAQVVRYLLTAGSDPNRSDFTRTTPLIAAVRPAEMEVVKLLVEAGANVNMANRAGDTPLTNAATWGGEPIVAYLLASGADPKLPDGVGMTASELARQQNHLAVAELLVRAEAER